MAQPNVQWQVDNQHEIDHFLREFHCRTERSGDTLLIVGPMGLEIELLPGDCLLLEGDQVGVVRVPEDQREKEKPRIIDTQCANCEKPIQVQVTVLKDSNAIHLVCSEDCREAYEFKLKFHGGSHPPLDG